MHIDCIQTDEALQGLSKEWNRLLNNSRCGNIFITWEWMSSWLEFFKEDAKLYVIAVRDEKEQLVGIAPLKIAQFSFHGFSYRQLEFIGSGNGVNADYLDFIIESGKEEEVIKEILAYIRINREEWDVINLMNVLEESYIFKIIPKMALENGWTYKMESGLACPYITLCNSWDAFQKTIKGKMKYEMRRRLKLLEANHKVEFIKLRERDELVRGLNIFFSLHESRWEKRGTKGIFEFHEKVREFHESLAFKFYEKDWLRLFFVKMDGIPVASLYGFEYGGKFFHYNAGFDDQWAKYGIAKQLIAFVIEDCIKLGLREFDFLKGAEPYKYEWTSQERRLVRLLLWNDTMRSRLHRASYAGYHRIKEGFRNKFPSTFDSLKSIKRVITGAVK